MKPGSEIPLNSLLRRGKETSGGRGFKTGVRALSGIQFVVLKSARRVRYWPFAVLQIIETHS